jgi:hypothetical protein
MKPLHACFERHHSWLMVNGILGVRKIPPKMSHKTTLTTDYNDSRVTAFLGAALIRKPIDLQYPFEY